MKLVKYKSIKLLITIFFIQSFFISYSQTFTNPNGLNNTIISSIKDSLELARNRNSNILIEKYEICLNLLTNEDVKKVFSNDNNIYDRIPFFSVHEWFTLKNKPTLLYGQTSSISVCHFMNQLAYKFLLFDLNTNEQIIVFANKTCIDCKYNSFEKKFNGECILIINPQLIKNNCIYLSSKTNILIVMI